MGDELEVVHRRHLLPSLVEVPLPRLLVKAQRAMEEAEAGFRREWEKLEAVAKEEEDRLSTLRTDLEARTRALEGQRLRPKEESQSLSQRIEVLQHREAEVEGLLAEQRTGVQQIAKWVDEASTTLEPLGVSPIQAAEAPSSIGSVLPALESAAERLQRLESTLVARLEAAGRELARIVVGHVLTCFRSHDPAISLTPVLEGSTPEAEAAAREGVREAVEIMASLFECNVEPDL
jgi:septal ring factor EnvC (AmiA/AmiB activator)